jgi:hypothetical protein
MKFYPEDYSVEVVVGFTDLNGAPVIPTKIIARLWDGDDQLIADFGELPFDIAAGEKSITVPKQFNILGDGEIRAARILRIELQTDAGSIRRPFSYAIEAEQRLELLTNTFASLEAAEFLALDMPNATGWKVASEDQKLAALTESFRRLTQIPMKFPTYGPGNVYSDYNTIAPRDLLEETIIQRDQWGELTIDEYETKFPAHFKKALRRAQFIEANELLQGDNVTQKHRSGIVTETIGESSITLRAGRVDYGVASQTLQALVGYIYFNMRIVRA